MTTVRTTLPPETSSVSSGSDLAGTGTLVRFMLRRDRVKLPAWAGGLGIFVLYVATAVPAAFETDEELVGATQLFHDPVGRMLTGPGYGFDAPTYERFVANGYGLYLLVLAALMSILLVVRHTRVEEQSGRAELVRANVVGRHASLTATVIVAAITNLVATIAIFLTMIGIGGFGAAGSLVFAASIGAVGLTFAGVTSITTQLTSYARAASGMAGIVLGAAFVLRAGGDLAEEGGTALSWLSPLGWGQQTAPFVLDRWWPLLFPAAFIVLTTALGFVLSTRRDVGASLFSVRPGPERAVPWLGTPLGLAFRLQRSSIVGWTAAVIVSGFVFGAFADALLQAVDDMPAAFLDLFGAEDLLAGYLAYLSVLMAYIVSVFVVLAVQGVRHEETEGRGEPILATPVPRATWLMTNLAVTAAAAVLLMALSGLATGIGAAIVTGDGAYIDDLLLANLNQIPPVLVVLGVATLLFGVAPRLLPLTWALVGYGMIVGTFGPILDLPSRVLGLSPYEHPAQLPVETFALPPLVTLTALGFAGVFVGLLGLRRRGINVV